ncbi:TniB family NTP-binding protein [Stenotrophomonas maltophilia]|nr:TniB family NTP-binding protein [Stenotrophomonas maltophilia]
MNALSHLLPEVRAVMDQSPALRLRHMQTSKWFNYAAAETILQRMETLLDHPPTHRMPGMLLLGESNSGKTSLGLEFMSRHPIDPNLDGDAVRVPVIRIEMPPNPDEARIYDEILLQLLQPFRTKDPISVKARQVQSALKVVGVRMLIIDEFQAVLSSRNDRRRLTLEVVKHLSNTLQIPLVAIGTAEAQVAVSKDEQLANRLHPVWMPTWRLDMEFRRLMAAFQATLPLREKSPLQDRRIAALILELSEGLLGEMTLLLCKGVERALLTGTECIDEALLLSLAYTPPSRRRLQRRPGID